MFAHISLTKRSGGVGANPKPATGNNKLVIDFNGIWDQLKGGEV